MEWGPERSRLQVIRAEHLRKQRRKFKYVKLFSFGLSSHSPLFPRFTAFQLSESVFTRYRTRGHYRQKEKVRTANGHLARLIN